MRYSKVLTSGLYIPYLYPKAMKLKSEGDMKEALRREVLISKI